MVEKTAEQRIKSKKLSNQGTIENESSQIQRKSHKLSVDQFEYLTTDASFTSILRAHCERAGKLHYDTLAAAADLDTAYVYRLIKGEKSHPSPNTIIRLALALQLTVPQTDELLMAAGYIPLVRPRKWRDALNTSSTTDRYESLSESDVTS